MDSGLHVFVSDFHDGASVDAHDGDFDVACGFQVDVDARAGDVPDGRCDVCRYGLVVDGGGCDFHVGGLGEDGAGRACPPDDMVGGVLCSAHDFLHSGRVDEIARPNPVVGVLVVLKSRVAIRGLLGACHSVGFFVGVLRRFVGRVRIVLVRVYAFVAESDKSVVVFVINLDFGVCHVCFAGGVGEYTVRLAEGIFAAGFACFFDEAVFQCGVLVHDIGVYIPFRGVGVVAVFGVVVAADKQSALGAIVVESQYGVIEGGLRHCADVQNAVSELCVAAQRDARGIFVAAYDFCIAVRVFCIEVDEDFFAAFHVFVGFEHADAGCKTGARNDADEKDCFFHFILSLWLFCICIQMCMHLF